MTAEIWAGIIGLILPFVVEYLKKAGVSGGRLVNFIVAGVAAIIVGTGSAYFSGDLSFEGQSVLGSIGAAFVAAQTAYNVYFKPLNLDDRISGSKT
jgi:riboflavin transporter FmnP